MPLTVTGLSENDKFHCFKDDYAERSLNTALEKGSITQDDVDLIRLFVSERRIVNAICAKRVLKLASSLITIRRYVGPYKQITIPEVYLGVERINNGTSFKGTPFTQNTKSDLIQVFKQFILWMIENEFLELPEKKIKVIRLPKKVPTKTAADLLTVDEMEALLGACITNRDRALFMTMYEGGFRVGEMGAMKWGDIKIDQTGVIINVTFKTGIPRYIRLVMSKEYLVKWKSDYPKEITEDAYVFLTENNNQLTHGAVSRQIGRLARRAGIEKHLTPHIFRHSRITHLIQQGVNESVIKLMMWGTVDSKMFINYAHLTGNDIDREIYKLYGIEPKAVQESAEKLEPRVCPNCNEVNSPISKYCHLCSHALDQNTLESADAFQRFLLNNSELITDFLKEREKRGEVHPHLFQD